jgi:hypothetical protein
MVGPVRHGSLETFFLCNPRRELAAKTSVVKLFGGKVGWRAFERSAKPWRPIFRAFKEMSIAWPAPRANASACRQSSAHIIIMIMIMVGHHGRSLLSKRSLTKTQRRAWTIVAPSFVRSSCLLVVNFRAT